MPAWQLWHLQHWLIIKWKGVGVVLYAPLGASPVSWLRPGWCPNRHLGTTHEMKMRWFEFTLLPWVTFQDKDYNNIVLYKFMENRGPVSYAVWIVSPAPLTVKDNAWMTDTNHKIKIHPDESSNVTYKVCLIVVENTLEIIFMCPIWVQFSTIVLKYCLTDCWHLQ